MKQFINIFKKITDTAIKRVNDKVIDRYRKVDFRTVLHCISQMVLSKDNSYNVVVCDMNKKSIYDGSVRS